MRNPLNRHWIYNGVYYGFSDESIVDFCKETYHARTELYKRKYEKSILDGTGFIPAYCEIDKDPQILIAEINERRFDTNPFTTDKIVDDLVIDNFQEAIGDLDKFEKFIDRCIALELFIFGKAGDDILSVKDTMMLRRNLQSAVMV